MPGYKTHASHPFIVSYERLGIPTKIFVNFHKIHPKFVPVESAKESSIDKQLLG